MLHVEIGNIHAAGDAVSLGVCVEKPLVDGCVQLGILPAAHGRDIGLLWQAQGLVRLIRIIVHWTKCAG